MLPGFRSTCVPQRLAFLCTVLIFFFAWISSYGAGVTLITHGYNSDANGWVTGMADAIPGYDSFPGTNFTCYKITVTYSGGSYLFSAARTNGVAPSASDSGEIIVKFDWSQLADDLTHSYASTYGVALATSLALQQTNLIAELGGHALVEWPIHLVGHSRGGSLIAELSRDLGTNGIWVDHLTTLDPHPLNNDGNSDIAAYSDAPVHTYVNVLYHDNYWEDLEAYPHGEPVAGAYVRQLTSLSGGYGSQHSNVHLWYHGTINWATPASDTESTITISERTNWWSAYEQEGVVAGFLYSRIGGGDRLSTVQPLGPGFPAIRDGYNQRWDLGAGAGSNRTALPSNNGKWPSLVQVDRMDTNPVVSGQTVAVQFYYQWAVSNTNLATVSLYLDNDWNPVNTNQVLLTQFMVAATTSSNVNLAQVAVPVDSSIAPGLYTLLAKISGKGQSRFLYAPELVQVIPVPPPPVLDVTQTGLTQLRVGVNAMSNQTIVLQRSLDLIVWQSIATNTLVSNRWEYFDNSFPTPDQRLYRAWVP